MSYDRVLGGPGAALWRAANLWARREREALEQHGLTPVQFLLLAGLGDLGGDQPVTQTDLARHCGADPMMVSQVLRGQEKAGLVRRRTHPADSRARAVSLTGRGRGVLARALESMVDAQDAFFGPLARDTEAFTGALRLLVGEKPRRRVAAARRP